MITDCTVSLSYAGGSPYISNEMVAGMVFIVLFICVAVITVVCVRSLD